jgi:HK97 family phage prohead protease
MKRINFDKSANAATFKRLAIAKQFAVSGERGLKGYAAVWDKISAFTGGEFALFPKGSAVLPTYQVRCLYNHNDDYTLAVESNGSLVVAQDDVGVSVNATLDDTFIDNFVYTKVSKGTIGGMSVGIYPITTHIERRVVSNEDAATNAELVDYIGDEIAVTVYDQWLLDEVTFTANPAFPQTTAEIFARNEGAKAKEWENNDNYLWQIELTAVELD